MEIIYTGMTRSDAKRRVAVMIDECDFDLVSKFQWQADKFGSIKGRVGGQQMLLARFLLNAPRNLEVDHIDGNRLNNQRSNLRLATSSQNKCNRGPRKDNKSGLKGVSWHSQRSQWTARIKTIDGKYLFLGLFESKKQAALAYNLAAIREHGEFAFINQINSY